MVTMIIYAPSYPYVKKIKINAIINCCETSNASTNFKKATIKWGRVVQKLKIKRGIKKSFKQ